MLSTKSSGVGGAGKAEERCALGGVKVNCLEGADPGLPTSCEPSIKFCTARPAQWGGICSRMWALWSFQREDVEESCAHCARVSG
jgi:hypothetical protein